MTAKMQTSNWREVRENAREHAAGLERQAATTRLLAMAEDPLDALAALWDVTAFDRHATMARRARLHGTATPQPPVPISRLVSGFTQQLRDKCIAVAALMKRDEIERLTGIAPGFVAALETNDADVKLLVGDLLPRDPHAIASWLRTHLVALEARFAS